MTLCIGLMYYIQASNEKIKDLNPIPYLKFTNKSIEEMQSCIDKGNDCNF